MTPEETNFTVVLSLASSLLASAIVAAYFRFLVKPKSEKVFEHNRESNLQRIFNQLRIYDNFNVGQIFDTLEKEFGSLECGKSELINENFKFVTEEELENQEITDFVKNRSDEEKLAKLNSISKIRVLQRFHENFKEDYNIYSQYLHDSFLRDINQYYLNTNLYVEWLLKNHKENSCLDERKNNAENIIKYLKEDRSIDKETKSIKDFIDKWGKEFKHS